jgi:hypothetical protein
VDLLKLQHELQQDGVEPALEKSNRGGHLWIFFEQPAIARDCRVYICRMALRLGLLIKGAGLPEGLEIFPRRDELGEGEFGNVIRAPLGFCVRSMHAARLPEIRAPALPSNATFWSENSPCWRWSG